MTVRSSFQDGWDTGFHLVGGILATIAQMVGVASLVILVMGATIIFYEAMLVKDCGDTGIYELINSNYTLECKLIPGKEEANE